jgi:hypothetical protein
MFAKRSWFLVAGMLAAGCSPRGMPPVRGYKWAVLSAGGVPGKTGLFQARVRLQRTDGGPVIRDPGPGPGRLPDLSPATPTSMANMGMTWQLFYQQPAHRRFLDITLRGKLPRPPSGPTPIGLELVEIGPIPLWERLLFKNNASGQVVARSPVGSFILPAKAPPGSSGRRQKPRSP